MDYHGIHSGQHLVVYDTVPIFEPKFQNSKYYGFSKYKRLDIPDDIWPNEYYKPVLKQIRDNTDFDTFNALEQREWEMLLSQAENVLGNPRKFITDFFILQKR